MSCVCEYTCVHCVYVGAHAAWGHGVYTCMSYGGGYTCMSSERCTFAIGNVM